MRKFLLLLVLCLGSVGATFAQIKISGKVVDAETGQPLIGATVMIGTTTGEGVAAAMDRMYEGDALKRFRENCVEERRRFSWEEMCSRVTELYGLVASGK